MNWRNLAVSGWLVTALLIVIMVFQSCQPAPPPPQPKPELKMETYRFGIPWEEPYSYSQGCKIGNTIYVAGQLAHDMEGNLNEGDFNSQFRQTLDNSKKVLAHYGATLDDVVFLQNFVINIEDTGEGMTEILKEYFPKGQQAMTIAAVKRLFGPKQLVESNMIAVVKE